MGDEAEDRYTLNIDCRQSKHRDVHSHCPHARRVVNKDSWSNKFVITNVMLNPSHMFLLQWPIEKLLQAPTCIQKITCQINCLWSWAEKKLLFHFWPLIASLLTHSPLPASENSTGQTVTPLTWPTQTAAIAASCSPTRKALLVSGETVLLRVAAHPSGRTGSYI